MSGRRAAPALHLLLLLAAGCAEPGDDGPGPAAGDVDAGALDAAATDAGEVSACGEPCDAPQTCIGGWCTLPVSCAPGETSSCYSERQIWTCTATPTGQTGFIPTDCEPGWLCSDAACRPNLCAPAAWYCEGLAARKQCNADGTAFSAPEPCDPGEICSDGECGSSCQVDPKFGNYVGCAFWTVDLPQYPDPFGDPEVVPHVVVVSNPGDVDAEISFDAPPGFVVPAADPVVPAGAARAFEMPVMNTQHNSVSRTAIRLQSTRPVLAHQFNPFHNADVFSNDASLLIPESALGADYVVMTWASSIPLAATGEAQNGYFTVVAVHDQTEVTVRVAGKVDGGGGVPAMAPGAVELFELDRGDVLNVESNVTAADLLAGVADLTGSTVAANKPVVVFAGHEEAFVGEAGQGGDNCCAEHLEEQLIPISSLGSRYLAVKTRPRGTEPDHWRIQAAEDGVSITTTPPIPGAHGVTLAARGDWLEVATAESFEVEGGGGKLQVGQFLVGKNLTADQIGDPSFILAVPVERLRASYTISVPTGYAHDYVTIVKPAGATVSTSDGPVPALDFQPFGSGAWSYGYLELTPGVATLTGDQPFALSAYGYDTAVSYGYPGGMQLGQ